MTDAQTLRLEAAAARAASAREELEAEIVRARSEGLPLRTIATAAGMSHESVRKIAS
jgi:hypothetical protein